METKRASYYQDGGGGLSRTATFGSRPDKPKFDSQIDPETGLLTGNLLSTSTDLQPEMQTRLDAIQMDNRGLDKFREFALGEGDSQFAKLMLEKQKLNQQTAMEDASKNAATQAAQARSRAAMRGGLDAGASERLGKSAMLSGYNQQQQLQRQGLADQLSIRAQDAQARQQALSQLPGMEVQALAPELQKTNMWYNAASGDNANRMNAGQFNIGNAMNERNNSRNFGMQQYIQDMGAWAAGKQADAQIASAQGSCWLISALSRFVKLPADQPELLTQFKRHMLLKDLEGTKFYIRRCGKLIEKMDAAGFDWAGFKWFNDALVAMLRAGETHAAYSLFRSTLCDLLETYWPECPYKTFTEMRQERQEKVSMMKTAPMLELHPAELPLADQCLTNLGADCFAPAT